MFYNDKKIVKYRFVWGRFKNKKQLRVLEMILLMTMLCFLNRWVPVCSINYVHYLEIEKTKIKPMVLL